MYIQHTYAMIRGKGTEMASLYLSSEQWIDEQGYARDTFEDFIIETCHPMDNLRPPKVQKAQGEEVIG
ncbi:hypothetical protein G3A_07265 [Bacillus sp. 17376]|uniref:Uncharacterized protein n=1 Tax=Mesobacillus boroniphilus JCM 21738 TaxID=1294265 RepID=W4RVW7_9BACI|nr:hypothetical protein [Mesobacillus boroniphilus]ESU33240.1 hypothetical protein G3A_07265 [Bacillus sp. 17376]GAE48421.1 hypothetical protein JCM21738_5540 [Mesobacillus boroniphilus JCM 21738]